MKEKKLHPKHEFLIYTLLSLAMWGCMHWVNSAVEDGDFKYYLVIALGVFSGFAAYDAGKALWKWYRQS